LAGAKCFHLVPRIEDLQLQHECCELLTEDVQKSKAIQTSVRQKGKDTAGFEAYDSSYINQRRNFSYFVEMEGCICQMLI